MRFYEYALAIAVLGLTTSAVVSQQPLQPPAGTPLSPEFASQITTAPDVKPLTDSLKQNSLLLQDRQDYCVGGTKCGSHCSGGGCIPEKAHLAILDRPHKINLVYVVAHDCVGNETRAHLIVKIDGVDIGRQDVKCGGSQLSFPADRDGQVIGFESVHESNYFGGDETLIEEIVITGK